MATSALLLVCIGLAQAAAAEAGQAGQAGGPARGERQLREALRQDVEVLAGRFPGRHVTKPEVLEGAAAWIEGRLREAGLQAVSERYVATTEGGAEVESRNLIAEVRGTTRPEEIIVIGAHYDAMPETPGADDNASGVAVGLALAEAFAERPQGRTLRFTFFTNEEPPLFQTPQMGSMVRASAERQAGERVVAMMSLEMLGYYSEGPVSPQVQQVAGPLGVELPETDDFVVLAAWPGSAQLVRRVHAAWEGPVTAVPVVAPEQVAIVGWSDQWSYWQNGFPALMVTDTSFLRNPHYHEPTDTPETLDYTRMASVTRSLGGVIEALADDAGPEAPGPDAPGRDAPAKD
ncbi:MAG: M28 family peptidase [Phycisphaerae bacterium]